MSDANTAPSGAFLLPKCTRASIDKGMQEIWKAQPIQALALACPVEVILFGGARGGGKSDFVIGKTVQHIQAYGPDAAPITFRRTYDELAQIKKRAAQLLPRLGASFYKSENAWCFPNGANWLLRYLESDQDATRYQGHEYTLAQIDEAGNFPHAEPIDMLKGTLRSRTGIPTQMVMTANPGGRGHAWLYERFVKNKRPFTPYYDAERAEWRVFIPSRLQDNQALITADPGYVNRLRGTGPDWLVKAWLEGDWNISVAGPVFQREHLQTYQLLPHYSTRYTRIQSWDTAFKTKEQNDYSVCITADIYPWGIYIVHVWRGKVPFYELKRRALELAAEHKCTNILIEDKAAGQPLLQELQRETSLGLVPIEPHGDKLARAYAVTPLVESRRVFVPEQADWRGDFIDELVAFPKGSHDDSVDAFTQLLSYVAPRYLLRGEEAEQPVTATDEEPRDTFLYDDDEHGKTSSGPAASLY